MAIYETIPYINPAEKMADANSLIAQAQADNAFAEQLVQLAILGHGDQDAARHLLSTTRAMLGDARINQQFWVEQAKKEKEVFKLYNDLVKSN